MLDFPSGAGVRAPPVPRELGNRRPRLFMYDSTLHAVGTSDPVPNVPTPKRDRAEVESTDDELDNAEQPGGGKRLHVEKRATKLV